ncbi:hypothetical protein CHS0354_034676 [Potamilus streckersoni]|uniref:Uncharacterized protein n=1 Tax=Potamilus streckersoni TaxID=2493646 RepID=A0AAE0TCW7_9BIVA|nr:hypothetical protein CHS0354_034676 [Potamilus streckersoni]
MSLVCWTFAFTLILGSVTAFLFDVINGPTSNNAEPPLRIGAMNVQVFGTAKLQHEIVRSVLPKILTRYDVIQVQEIRDNTDSAFESLRHLMNEELKAKHVNDAYEKVISIRLGRTNSKEQYGFLFRKSKVHLTDSYQYPDPGDIFEREPFVVRFSSPQTDSIQLPQKYRCHERFYIAAVAEFAIAGIHTSPTHAKDEIGNLTKVYDAIKHHWNLDMNPVDKFLNSTYYYPSESEFFRVKIGHWKIASCFGATSNHYCVDTIVISLFDRNNHGRLNN